MKNSIQTFLIIALVFFTTMLISTTANAQINYCDSIEIEIDYQTPNAVYLTSNLNVFNTPILTANWCLSLYCGTCIGTSTDTAVYFSNLIQSDTMIICLNTMYVSPNGITVTCNTCDTLFYNQITYQWEFMSMISNPTSIEELKINSVDNKIYDMLGRELTKIPIGTVYIQNRKLYIKK